MENKQLVEEIYSQWKPSEERCGKLIECGSLIWHYSVALNNGLAICWGGMVNEPGQLSIHSIGPHLLDTYNPIYLDRERILENIIASVSGFNNSWIYCLGWNCEHWARLVTTGEPKCCQLLNYFFGILSFTKWVYRHEAIPQLVKSVAAIKSK